MGLDPYLNALINQENQKNNEDGFSHVMSGINAGTKI